MLSTSWPASTSFLTIWTSRAERPVVVKGIWTGRNLASWAERFSVAAGCEEQEYCARAGFVTPRKPTSAVSRSASEFVISQFKLRTMWTGSVVVSGGRVWPAHRLADGERGRTRGRDRGE